MPLAPDKRVFRFHPSHAHTLEPRGAVGVHIVPLSRLFLNEDLRLLHPLCQYLNVLAHGLCRNFERGGDLLTGDIAPCGGNALEDLKPASFNPLHQLNAPFFPLLIDQAAKHAV